MTFLDQIWDGHDFFGLISGLILVDIQEMDNHFRVARRYILQEERAIPLNLGTGRLFVIVGGFLT